MADKQRPSSLKQPKSVTIEEDYFDFRGQCYYAWRVEGAKDWHFKATGHTQRPYIKWLKLSEVEYNDRLRRYGLGNDLAKNSPEASTEAVKSAQVNREDI